MQPLESAAHLERRSRARRLIGLSRVVRDAALGKRDHHSERIVTIERERVADERLALVGVGVAQPDVRIVGLLSPLDHERAADLYRLRLS